MEKKRTLNAYKILSKILLDLYHNDLGDLKESDIEYIGFDWRKRDTQETHATVYLKDGNSFTISITAN